MQPTTIDYTQVNHMGAELGRLRREEYGLLSRIDSIDDTLRTTVGLIAEFASCKLKIIEDLLSLPTECRDYRIAEEALKLELDKVKKENLSCFRTLLEGRSTYVEAERKIDLTTQKREELIVSFSSLIESKIEGEKLEIGPKTDLELLKTKIEQELQIQLSTNKQLLESKKQIVSALHNTQSAQNTVKKTQSEAFTERQSVNLWEAAEVGDKAFIKKTIKALWYWDRKDAVNSRDQGGLTPLALSCTYGHLSCAQYLLKRKADPTIADDLGYHPLHWAAKKGFVQIAALLLENEAPVNALGDYKRTPLHMAAHNGRDQMVELLCNRGADPNKQADKGDASVTPLHEAILLEHHLVILALLKVPRLNVNIVDAKKCSPLFYAIQSGRVDFATLIIGHLSWKKTIDPSDPNHMGKLLTLNPPRNRAEVKAFLERYVK